jgi:large subunit ribosomal protein L35
MPKMKTSKSVAKRVKVTARGKVMRHRAGAGHLKSRKSPGRLRRLRKITTLSKGMIKHAKHRLGLM